MKTMTDNKNIKNLELHDSGIEKVRRCHDILINKNEVSDAELDELIKYLCGIEEYEICSRLKKLKTSE